MKATSNFQLLTSNLLLWLGLKEQKKGLLQQQKIKKTFQKDFGINRQQEKLLTKTNWLEIFG